MSFLCFIFIIFIFMQVFLRIDSTEFPEIQTHFDNISAKIQTLKIRTSKMDHGGGKPPDASSSLCAAAADDEEIEDQPMHPTNLNPSDFLKMKPKKSILKAKQTSVDDLQRAVEQREFRGHSEEAQKAHFDEMNILATHHPPDKDYGHMKIDEPKTPYHNYSDSEGEELIAASGSGTNRPRRVSLVGAVDADQLRKGIAVGGTQEIKVLDPPGSGEDDEDSETGLTEEQLARKREFERKRKTHYNEGEFLRKMREKKEDEDEAD